MAVRYNVADEHKRDRYESPNINMLKAPGLHK
jgi:hypothetical protein